MDNQSDQTIGWILLGLVVCCLSTSSLNAQKYDYQWGFGYGSNPELGFGMTVFDWNDGVFSISNGGSFIIDENPSEEFRLGTGGACIADRDGKLALMSNNCHIVGADTDTIQNGSHISPSPGWEDWCLQGGFQGRAHNVAFLPNRLNDSITYLAHRMRWGYWEGNYTVITADTLYLSTIEQQVDGGYVVTDKNRKILELPAINGRVIGIPTEDEHGWWVFSEVNGTNEFYFQRINPDGTVSEPVISVTGPISTWENNADNALNISNDGRTIALSSEEYGTLLYTFDRSTGEITYVTNLPPPDDSGNSWADGYCWSPSNRFLYVAEGWDIVQYDMQSSNLQRDSVHILNTLGMLDSTNFVVSLGSGYLGPDCRIYFSSGSASNAFHVIHYPDRKGLACTVQANIPLPNRMAWNFPMITKFRMGSSAEEVCDESIEWFGAIPSSVEEAEQVSESLQVLPNPSDGQIIIGLQGTSEFELVQFYDVVGHLVYTVEDWYGGYIDISSLRSGVYVVKALRDEQWHSSKLVLK